MKRLLRLLLWNWDFGVLLAMSAWLMHQFGWTALIPLVVTALAFVLPAYFCEIRHIKAAIAKLRGNRERVTEDYETIGVEIALNHALRLANTTDAELLMWRTEHLDPDSPAPAAVRAAFEEIKSSAIGLQDQHQDLTRRSEASLSSMLAAREEAERIMARRASARVKRRLLQAGVAEFLTSSAVRVAGTRHAHLHESWRADLVGVPEEGITVSPRERLTMAAGFLLAGLRLRVRDLMAPFWTPVDWLLSVDSRLNTFVTTAVGATAVYFDITEGLHALLVERSEPCALLGGGLYALARWLRKRRGIEVHPPTRRTER